MDCNRKRGMKRVQTQPGGGTPVAKSGSMNARSKRNSPIREAPARTWRMPAEWEPHAATWLAWPHERSDWPGKFATLPWVYAEILRHVITCELIHLLVNDARAEALARRVLDLAGVDPTRMRFFRIPARRV